MKWLKKIFKVLGISFLVLLLLLVGLYTYVHFKSQIHYPEVDKAKYENLVREKVAENHCRIGNNWLKLNEYGVWEMYIEGAPYERGLIYGKLAEELVQQHEDYFIAQIDKLVPSRFYFNFLRIMIGWFNRDIDKHITTEYQQEIYGISQSFSSEYDILGDRYLRVLNYHAAHDIGHALADYAIVGCTSFSVNNEMSADSNLLIGRNFDFYMGDDFAKNKLVTIVNPDEGFQFLMYSWAGLAGVVSGMNEMGLTVTLNASKSELPTESKTPISILAREIVQYASTIDEAIAIANKRETFVSESLMIGSALDNRTVIIEKTPFSQDVFVSETDVVVCSNHYQAPLFANDSINLWNIKNSDSEARRLRVNELLEEKMPLDINEAVSILRDQRNSNNEDIGMGNPKAINQLLAHHSIIFKPSKGLVWISTPPYQLGNFLAYNVKNIGLESDKSTTSIESLILEKDSFLETKAYENFEDFKITKHKIFDIVSIGIKDFLSEAEITKYINDNPNSYVTYLSLGDYFKEKANCERAKKYYNMALEKEVSSLLEVESIKAKLAACSKK